MKSIKTLFITQSQSLCNFPFTKQHRKKFGISLSHQSCMTFQFQWPPISIVQTEVSCNPAPSSACFLYPAKISKILPRPSGDSIPFPIPPPGIRISRCFGDLVDPQFILLGEKAWIELTPGRRQAYGIQDSVSGGCSSPWRSSVSWAQGERVDEFFNMFGTLLLALPGCPFSSFSPFRFIRCNIWFTPFPFLFFSFSSCFKGLERSQSPNLAFSWGIR